jgi:flagellar biosynthesis protein FliP
MKQIKPNEAMKITSAPIKTQTVDGAVLQAAVDVIVAARNVSARAPAKPQKVSVRIPAHVIEELRAALKAWDEL